MSEEPATALLQEIFDLAVATGSARRGEIIPKPFVVRHGGYAIRVEYSAGSSKDLSLHADYDTVARADHADARGYRAGAVRPLAAPRPLAIELRREDGGHVAARARGLNVEWQSGDVAFDRAVYVDTPTTDPEVLAAVIGPEVRRAVCELLALGFLTVSIDDDGAVCACITEFTTMDRPRANRGADALSAFAHIHANLPAIATSGRTVRHRPLVGVTIGLALVGAAGWGCNYFYLNAVLAISRDAWDLAESAASLAWWECVGAVAIGVLAGTVGLLLYGRLVAALARGTSSAHKDVQHAQLAAFFGTSVVAFTGVVIAIVLSHAE